MVEDEQGGKHYFDLSHGAPCHPHACTMTILSQNTKTILIFYYITLTAHMVHYVTLACSMLLSDSYKGIFSTSWTCPAQQISLPELVRGASAIDLYIEVANRHM